MSTTPYIGEVMPFGGNFAIRGWAKCEGQLLPIASNTALFSILGTTYGGDGRTTFGLPDLRGRSMIGAGQGPALSNVNLGAKSGAETATLTVANLPSHNHSVSLHAENTAAVSGNPTGRMLGRSGGDTIYSDVDAANDRAMAPQSIQQANVGNNQAFSIRDPYLAITWLIALEGVYPSRD